MQTDTLVSRHTHTLVMSTSRMQSEMKERYVNLKGLPKNKPGSSGLIFYLVNAAFIGAISMY